MASMRKAAFSPKAEMKPSVAPPSTSELMPNAIISVPTIRPKFLGNQKGTMVRAVL